MPEVTAIWASVQCDTSRFEAGMRRMGDTMRAAERDINTVGRTGGGVSRDSASWFSQFTATMSGFAATNVLGRIASGLEEMVRKAIEAAKGMIGAAAEEQRIEMQLEAVLRTTGAAAAKKGQEYAEAASQSATWTKLSSEKLQELRTELTGAQLDYNTLTAQIQEQKQRIYEMTTTWTDAGLNVGTARARL